MAGVVYQIQLQQIGNLSLSVDPKKPPSRGGQLIVANPDPGDPLQLWQWIFYPQTQASILYNPKIDLFAAPLTLENEAPVVLFQMAPTYDGGNTWQVFQNSVARPPANTDLNLNASGEDGGPYAGSPVIVYFWQGGKANMHWTSVQV